MLLAQRIIRDVVRRHLQLGDHLPPEHLMLETYSVGRSTLREALRLLEFQGIIALKPGPNGGPVLLDPDPSHLASMLILLLQIKQEPFRAIVEVRTGLEPMISSLAAARMTEETLATLQQSIADMRRNLQDEEVFFEANKRFHAAIAWSSGNALFGYLVDSLLGIADGPTVGMDYPDPRRKSILKAHEEIYQALSHRDPRASENRMREHLEAYMRFAEKRYPDILNRVVSWDRATAR
jgi:GntR family transcriptional regulator, transcriptional repressor for pyruvate dehydrogenase complex